jgi:drug/metabolite transporter (DMT)-like permease
MRVHSAQATPRCTLGYALAVAAAAISGVSVYVNSLGVRAFADPVLYTALKDAFVGLALLVPLCVSPSLRCDYRRLDLKTWAWLVGIALTGGSVPFALFYTGLQLTTASTGALINHFQFVLVALFAAAFLRERLRPVLWTGLVVLLIAALLGTNLATLQWNIGALLIACSTVLFAIDFVIAKYLLRELATLTVMTARMTLGTAILLVYVVLDGRLAPVAALNSTQWTFVAVTGVLLLMFTVTTFTAIRHASVSTVLAVGTAAPIITTLLQFFTTSNVQLGPVDQLSLVLTLAAVAAIVAFGIRQENALAKSSRPAGPGR